MKIEKLVKSSSMWNWIKDRLPNSLVPIERRIGYGVSCMIYHRDNTPGVFARALDFRGDPVAIVEFDTIELFHPQYFSDFEALCQQYETLIGREVVLKFWNG